MSLGSSMGSDILIAPADLTYNSTMPFAPLGARATTGDGRYFRMALAGGVTLVPGTLLQCAAENTGLEDLDVAATAIGSTSVTTVSTVTLTANQLAEGYLIVTVTPGQGYQYKIKSHPAVTGAVVTLQLYDSIQVALTTGSDVDLVPSPYSGVIINPTVATGNPVGVAVFPITNAQYGWIQTGGPCTLLADGTVTVGTSLVASNGTAGAVEALTGVQAIVGNAITGIATTEYGAVNLFNI